MSRDLLSYGFNATLAIAGISTIVVAGMDQYLLSRTVIPSGASVFVSGVSVATTAGMVLMPSSLTVDGPAPLFFRSSGASGAVSIFNSTSQQPGSTLGLSNGY